MSDEKESLLLVVACEKRKNVLVAGFKFLGGGGEKGSIESKSQMVYLGKRSQRPSSQNSSRLHTHKNALIIIPSIISLHINNEVHIENHSPFK
jgi:hypothetical protein